MYPWVVNEIPFYPANASRSSKSTSALAERHCKEVNAMLAIFKICFCSLGLWGHQLWNYIPRVLVGAIVLYQAVYDFYVVLGCPGFDCGFLQNSTDKNKTSHHKDDRKIANAVYTIVTVAAVISYFLFIGCFIATRRNTYVALITPSESLDANNNDLDKKNVCCLCFAFTVITTLFLCSVAVFYAIIWKSQPRNSLSTHSRLEWVRSFSHNGQQLQLAMCLQLARLRFVSHALKRLLPERTIFSENETPKFDKILSAVKKKRSLIQLFQ